MSYSTNGATSHAIALAFGKQLGVKAKPIATGGPPATYTMTMTGQVDIGWGVMPFGLKEYQEGKFRIIARGSDVPSHAQTRPCGCRWSTPNALKERKDVMLRFMRAYRETLDWMYADPQAVKFYAEKMKMPEELVVQCSATSSIRRTRCCRTGCPISSAVEDAVKLKFLDKPMTKEELTEVPANPAGEVTRQMKRATAGAVARGFENAGVDYLQAPGVIFLAPSRLAQQALEKVRFLPPITPHTGLYSKLHHSAFDGPFSAFFFAASPTPACRTGTLRRAPPWRHAPRTSEVSSITPRLWTERGQIEQPSGRSSSTPDTNSQWRQRPSRPGSMAGPSQPC